MAKITFSSLKLKVENTDSKIIKIDDKEIEVKQYLPINDKLDLISSVLVGSIDGLNFANPIKIDVVTTLEIIYAYTNISFTDKQKEDPAKLYDILETNGIIDKVIEAIPEIEYSLILEGVEKTVEAYYQYKNSIKGIIENIAEDYDEQSMNITELSEKIANPQNLTLVKDIVTKLG